MTGTVQTAITPPCSDRSGSASCCPAWAMNLARTPVSSLVTALNKATQLVTVHVGDSSSSVVTAAGTVTATSQAQGAEIDVLPGLTLTGGPLLSIIVGSAQTTSTFNRTTGASAATFNPAILTVNLLGTAIPIGLGSPVTLFAGTPARLDDLPRRREQHQERRRLEVGAVADGVGLDLLTGLNGGISLHLAHAQSQAGGSLAVISPTTTTSTTKAPLVPITGVLTAVALATTGTSAPLLPIGLALILVGYITRRTLRTRQAHRSSTPAEAGNGSTAPPRMAVATEAGR